MTQLKKILEKPIGKEEIERLLWLQKGIEVIDEKGRQAAIEKNPKFLEKQGTLLSPDEFHLMLSQKNVKDEQIPPKYQKELYRYHQMLIKNISEMLELPEIRDAKLGRTLGIPNAKENLFEIKKEGKSLGFVHLNKKDMTIDFIKRLEDVPTGFKKKLKRE